jgi:gamma-glutamyltranspeptidase/glutathione hydrolase
MPDKFYTNLLLLRYFILLSFILNLGACRVQYKNPYEVVQSLVSDSAMVVAEHPLAAKAGLQILAAGGNAVDAAIASQFVLAVVNPRAGNIGGGGFMVIRMAEGEKAALDYREMAPAAANRDMYLDSLGEVVPELSTEGHLAVGVPGTVAGLEEAFRRYSALKDWKFLVQPAMQLAKEGFMITESEAIRLNRLKETFIKNNVDGKPFVKGADWKAGEMLVQPDLAETLRLIAEKGKAGFYEGVTADKIIAEMKRGGGLITHDDLKNYSPKWRTPIEESYKEFEVLTMPPPSSGGIALIQLLKMLEEFPLDEYKFQTLASVHAIAEAERRAYADRAEYLGDADFFDVPQSLLLDSTYMKTRIADFNPAKATSSDSVGAEKFKMRIESFETTHTSIVDKAGNAVAVTTTLNLNYGSKVIVYGAGFFLNDEMDDFSAKPGVPNAFGLVGKEANAIEPGKRMLSSMTPTILEKDGRLFMVLGAPGGSTIITAVLQTILNVTEYGMAIDEAVAAPRFHHQWLPDEIWVEPAAIDTAVRAELWKMGHKLKPVERMALVKAILVLPDGRLHGASDPRNPDDHVEGY